MKEVATPRYAVVTISVVSYIASPRGRVIFIGSFESPKIPDDNASFRKPSSNRVRDSEHAVA